MHHPTDRITHTTAFVTPVVEHWLEREIAQWRIDPMTHRTMSEGSYHRATSRSLEWQIDQWVYPMKDRSDDPSHHEWRLLPQSYISLLGMRNRSTGPLHEGSIRRPTAPWANALPLSYNPLAATIVKRRCTHRGLPARVGYCLSQTPAACSTKRPRRPWQPGLFSACTA